MEPNVLSLFEICVKLASTQIAQFNTKKMRQHKFRSKIYAVTAQAGQ